MKVKLPKEVAEAIEDVRNFQQENVDILSCVLGNANTPYYLTIKKYTCNHFDTFLTALVNGYEVIEEPEVITITPEQKERVKQYYCLLKTKADSEARASSSNTIKTFDTHEMLAIVTTLKILNIKVEGVNS